MAAEEFIRSKCQYVIHICNIKQDKNIMSFGSHLRLDEILDKHGIRSRRVSIHWNDFDFDGYFELAKCILEEYPDLDGLMAADLPATAFLKAAIALGKKIPEDFVIVAYDGTFVTKTCTTKMTTICQPYEKIAYKAVEILISLIGQTVNGTDVEKEVIFPVILEKGNTTK